MDKISSLALSGDTRQNNGRYNMKIQGRAMNRLQNFPMLT
jgi:hypothetical protein